MTPDINKAAVMASETLIRYNVKKFPVSPLKILRQMDNVIVVSFSDLSTRSCLDQRDLIHLFGKNLDAVTSVHMENGRNVYVLAYNKMLPFPMAQRALARELGHIVMKHEGSSAKNSDEAACFAVHLLCPRALIHAIQATGLRITHDLLANLTGVFDQSLSSLRRIPGASVPASMNRFVRSQLMPFIINFFEYYRTVLPSDGSALADFGTYMDEYEE